MLGEKFHKVYDPFESGDELEKLLSSKRSVLLFIDREMFYSTGQVMYMECKGMVIV